MVFGDWLPQDHKRQTTDTRSTDGSCYLRMLLGYVPYSHAARSILHVNPLPIGFMLLTPGMMLSLGLTCPSGGDFYVCGNTTRFLGCCTSDSCTEDAICPQADLRYSSFNASFYPQILPQACMEHDAASWYACDLEVPFLGCCALDPCTPKGCLDGDLRAARLSDNASNAEIFISDSHHFPTSPPPSKTNSSTNPTATGLLKAPSGNTSQVKHGELPLGAFIGIGVGGFLFCVACAGAIFLVKKTRKAPATAAPHQHLDDTHLSYTSVNDGNDSNTAGLSLYHENARLGTDHSHGVPIPEHLLSPCSCDNPASDASTCATAREDQAYRELDETTTWAARAYQPSRLLPPEDLAQRTRATVYQPCRPSAPVAEQQ